MSAFVVPFLGTTKFAPRSRNVDARHVTKSISVVGKTRMVAGEDVSRRSVLRGAGLAALGLFVAPALAFDKGELKEDAEALNYEDELTDVGPDEKEKNITRAKKKAKAPGYREEQQALVKAEDQKYDEMVAEELKEDKEAKAKYEEYLKTRKKN